MKQTRFLNARVLLITVIVAVGALRPLMWIAGEWGHCTAGICSVSGTPPEWDFTIFWEAGRLALARDFDDIFVFLKFHALIENQLHYDVGLSPFAYPPAALLIFAPLGLFPLGKAFLVWIVAGIVLLVAALRTAGLNWLSCAMVLASPPFLYNLMLGQNGAFSSALLISALAFSARNARVAGGAGALLTIKPQIGLLLPAVWAGGRQWKIFVYAALVFLVIFALTIALFGVQAWELYFRDTFPEMGRIMDEPFPQAFQANAITMFMFARAFGASIHTARIIQMVLTVVAFVTTYKVWSDDVDLSRKLASTIFLGLLAMPYGYTYDMIGYAAALALILQQRGLSPIWVALWLWPALSRDITVDLRVPVTSLVIFVAAIWSSRLPKAEGDYTVRPA